MKKFKFNKVSIIVLAIMFTLGLVGTVSVFAATAPGLGSSEGYSVWGAAGITGGAASHVWGNAGNNGTTDSSLTGNVAGTFYQVDQSATVGTDITAATGDLNGETLTQITVLDLDVPNTIGPGVYDVGTTATFSAALTLDGAGIYIFRGADSIAQTTGGTMILTGTACASDVYWQVGTQMTFAAAGNIEGTIIAGSAITFANPALTFKGRALAGTNVDLGGITITEPATCSTPEPTPPSPSHSSSGSTPTYGCKDPTATNYNYFSSSKPELCTYASVAKVVTPTVIIPKLPKTGFPPETWYESLINSLLSLFR